MILLGVNVDHVATLRQARLTYEPDPVWAAAEAELGGADIITVHLRQDRRHIGDRDIEMMSETVGVDLNLEMSIASEIVSIALDTEPEMATLVPEERREVTTESGLDVAGQLARVTDIVGQLMDVGTDVSLFVDPEPRQIEACAQTGARMVELHTGFYANVVQPGERSQRLDELAAGAEFARKSGLIVNAGHGLTYTNVAEIVRRVSPHELHIGHSIISRAVFVGLRQAVRDMKDVIFQTSVLNGLGQQN